MTNVLVPLLLTAIGIVLLYRGATMLIENATSLARNIGVPLVVVGFTIVALGTSLPELVVGIFAGAAGENDLVLGNILGSNMANLGLALGLAALISPVGLPSKNHRFELYSLVLAVSALYMLLRDGNLDRIDGLTLVAFSLVFMVQVIRNAARSHTMEQVIERVVTIQHRRERLQNGLAIAVGLILLLIGARMTVTNAVGLARTIGLSEVLVGILILAVGTSLPEIVTTVMASVKKKNSLSIGNVVGSNVMNVLLVLGLTVIIHPIQVRPTVWMYDLPFLVIVSLVVVTLVRSGRKISRREGAVLVGSYVTYVLFAFLLRL